MNHLIAAILILLLFFPGKPVFAEAGGDLALNASEEITFGESIEFRLSLSDEVSPKKVWLMIQPFQSELAVYEVPLTKERTLVFHLDLTQNPLRAFSEVNYWYQIDLPDGSQALTPTYQFSYTDNRFDWQHLESQQFAIHWYDGDPNIAADALNIAETARFQLESAVPVRLDEPIHLYLYASINDFQKTLSIGNLHWAGGQASPDLNVILIYVPNSPEQILELKRQIPHELAHFYEYALTGSEAAYEQIPLWLLEGFASSFESSPNPAYQPLLDSTHAQNALIPFSDLCANFPQDHPDNLLAYAESQSFVEHLIQHWGQPQLTALLSIYAAGVGCEEGFLQHYGISIGQAQSEWEVEQFGARQAVGFGRFSRLIPYLVMLLVLTFVPLISIIFPRLRRRFPSDKPDSGVK